MQDFSIMTLSLLTRKHGQIFLSQKAGVVRKLKTNSTRNVSRQRVAHPYENLPTLYLKQKTTQL